MSTSSTWGNRTDSRTAATAYHLRRLVGTLGQRSHPTRPHVDYPHETARFQPPPLV
jgi:hypothetical protein